MCLPVGAREHIVKASSIRRLKISAIGMGLVAILFFTMDWFFPLPDPARMKSVVVLAGDGTPLRAFADDNGVWRFPVRIEQVSPYYLEALLNYEDRWFYWHFGINPLALLRATAQWLLYGRAVSGGSTLTMQVARILEPHSRTMHGKLWQMFRALQLEWHYSKVEILSFYLNLAPYGGPIEGVQTASYAYLHKSARDLSQAEAALLAVLPQSPSRLRPDREPERAQRYRDKVLKRMQDLGVWDALTVQEAMMEEVQRAQFRQPMLAPLFAWRMAKLAREKQISSYSTTLNSSTQWSVENILRSRLGSLPDQSSAAILVMENASGYVRAYAGSVDFFSDRRFGHVDMVQAIRSPGSTLKPFLYGYALDDGLIHSESLLSDVPIQRQQYTPENFLESFHGPVSVTEALQASLNVPAVSVLQRLTPNSFYARLFQAGVPLQLPLGGEPNLSMVLGGVGARLEDLVRGYSAFARKGISIAPRFSTEDEIIERRVMSEGAAWIIRDILQGVAAPNGASSGLQVAWKTGTSYGFRDAWAVGTNGDYTVGVWTGRPDGTPLPGQYGSRVAGPILFDVFYALPRPKGFNFSARPSSVSEQTICWPLGEAEATTRPDLCRQTKRAWVLQQTIPPTLPHWQYPTWSAHLENYWVNSATGLRVNAACAGEGREARQIAVWPLELHAWLPTIELQAMRLPAWDSSCPEALQYNRSTDLRIEHLQDGVILYLPLPSEGEKHITLELQASGANGELTWLINQQVIGHQAANQVLRHELSKPGQYTIMALDSSGAVDKVQITLLDRQM